MRLLRNEVWYIKFVLSTWLRPELRFNYFMYIIYFAVLVETIIANSCRADIKFANHIKSQITVYINRRKTKELSQNIYGFNNNLDGCESITRLRNNSKTKDF